MVGDKREKNSCTARDKHRASVGNGSVTTQRRQGNKYGRNEGGNSRKMISREEMSLDGVGRRNPWSFQVGRRGKRQGEEKNRERLKAEQSGRRTSIIGQPPLRAKIPASDQTLFCSPPGYRSVLFSFVPPLSLSHPVTG